MASFKTPSFMKRLSSRTPLLRPAAAPASSATSVDDGPDAGQLAWHEAAPEEPIWNGSQTIAPRKSAPAVFESEPMILLGNRKRNATARKHNPAFSRLNQLWRALAPVLLDCPPYFGALWSFMMGPHYPSYSIGTFADGTVAYVFSVIWHDLLSAQLFGLEPTPLCMRAGSLAACDSASAHTLFVYAGALLLAAALVKQALAQPGARTALGSSAETLPVMISMVVGWSLGDACIRVLVEMRESSLYGLLDGAACQPPPFAGAPPDCTLFNLGAATLFTLLALWLVLVLQPMSKDRLESAPCAAQCAGRAEWLEAALDSFWELTARGASPAASARPSTAPSPSPPPPNSHAMPVCRPAVAAAVWTALAGSAPETRGGSVTRGALT